LKLEVVTWNIEYFPKSGQATIDSVVKIVLALDADVLALQEIDIEASFTQLLNNLNGWEGYHVPGSWPSLAYIYNANVIDVDSIYEIFPNDDREFPRPPLVMEMKFRNENFIIINNHFKCCGDNIIDHGDLFDEEKRRYDAVILMDQYIDSNFADMRVIVLGDLNDELTNATDDNVFQSMIDDDTSYKFVDLAIAQGPSSEWSFPSWPSHLDHIMITNELFDEFLNDSSDIQIIKIDDYLAGGFGQMDGIISDHRPVALKIQINPTIIITEVSEISKSSFTIYPNPSKGTTQFRFEEISDDGTLEIFNMNGQKIAALNVNENQEIVTWNPQEYSTGVYCVKLVIEHQASAVQKLVLLK